MKNTISKVMEGGGEALAMLKGQLVQLGLGVKVVK